MYLSITSAIILSKLGNYFSRKVTTIEEKENAATLCESFTNIFPIIFPDTNITRKMPIISFVLPRLIREDTTSNICFKLLQVEQAGERLHHMWNILIQSRFFAIKNGCDQLLSAMLQYENNLYLKNKY